MHKLYAPSVAALIAALAPAAFAADVCSLLSKNDAAAVLGQPVVQVTPAGPQRDADSGGLLSYCTYQGASSAVVVSVVEFTSEVEARKQVTSNLVQQRMDAEADQVSKERGPGEKAYYGFSAKGSMFVFLKKKKVIGVGVAGVEQNRSVTKETLRSIAQLVAYKA